MVTNRHHDDSDTAAPVIACTLGDRELAERSETVRRELFAEVLERREGPDGYAYRFPGNATWRERIAAFVEAETRCCAFLAMAVSEDAGSLWVSLTGPEGTKAFIEEIFDAGQPA